MPEQVAIVRHMQRPWFTAKSGVGGMSALKVYPGIVRTAPLTADERQLGWFVLPPFQRPPVWTDAQKIRFIESCWGGLPIGVYVYNRPESPDSPFDNWLLDGQQRITAVYAYMNDEFAVAGFKFSELTDVDRRFWYMIPFSSLETRLDDEEKLRDVYERLAYGGTPHVR